MAVQCPWPHPYGFPSGARQFLYIRTIDAVTLADGEMLLLELDENDYNCSTDDPLGYDRYTVTDHQALMTYGASGQPVVDGAWFESKYQFRWNLTLSQAKAATLKAIYDTQQIRLKALSTNYAVTLLDARLMLQECEPRTRAAITGAESNYPFAPQGQVYSYPIFDILLRKPDDAGELLGQSFQQRQTGVIEALELDKVLVSSDKPFNTTRIDSSGSPYWDNTEWV
jgi:hypothetical protein